MNNYRIYRNTRSLERGRESPENNPLLAIGIIDCGDRDRLLETLDWYRENLNYDLHVVTQASSLDIAQMQERYPLVTFIVFTTMAFSGEMINAFAAECRTTYFLIARTDCDLIRFDGSRLFPLMERSEHPAMTACAIANSQREIVPCVRSPRLEKEKLAVSCSFPNMEDDTEKETLYPVMQLGLYDRALFQRLRGYDGKIHSEYWQAMDWGIRCWLLGYPIFITRALLVQFPARLSIIEDISESEGYGRCPTKALSVRRMGGKNVIRRPSGDVDREVLKSDVRGRLIYLVKQDYPHLVETWKNDGDGQ